MAKDRYFFDHDYTARNDDKILELRASFGAEGYGLFWMIVETMAENENGGVKTSLIGGLSLGFGVANGRLLELIGFCIKIELFYENEGFIFSKRMLEHKEFRGSFSDYGKKGADKRWKKNSPPIAPPLTPLTPPLEGANAKQSITEQNISKENKEEPPAELFGNKGNETNLVFYDVEDLVLKNAIWFEKTCMNNKKGPEDAKRSLHKYHLHLQEKEDYPRSKKSLYAGFEKWLLNEKSVYNNGQHNASAVGKETPTDKF